MTAALIVQPNEVFAWVHTWWGRLGTKLPYEESLRMSDIDGWVHVERQPEGMDRDHFYLSVLKKAQKQGCRFILRIEDDTRVNRYFKHNVLTWPALAEPSFGMGFFTTCERVQKLVPCSSASNSIDTPYLRNTLEFRRHGYHFGGAWIARTDAVIKNLRRIQEILHYIRNLNGRFGPTTAVADALIDAGYWRMYVHCPALAEIDTSIDSHQMKGDLTKRYGNQPFDLTWRR